MKRLIQAAVLFFAQSFQTWFDDAAEGIEEHDVEKVVVNCFLIIVWAVIFIILSLLFLMVTIQHMPLVTIGGFLAAAMYSGVLKVNSETPEEPPIDQPTEADYFAVLETIRPAVAEVAQALELAPVYSHTDMAADSEERILPWGKVWRLKYKAPKKNAAIAIDTVLCKRIIQAQVKTVLERDNPSGFSAVRYQYGSSFVPIIQIDEIKDGDIFIYIFATIASEAYFKQKSAWSNRRNVLAIKGDADDIDF